MLRFKDKHKNKRAFIIANGPHLNDIPVEKLEGEITFGLNRGYLKKGLDIKYLVVINDLVEQQFKDEILAINCDARFTCYLEGPNTYQYKFTPDIPKFTGDITKPIWQGHTVTFCAMETAFFMGCDPVYVIGLDHKFDYSTSEKRKGKRGLLSKTDDPNHFHPDYWGKGVIWDAAELKQAEVGFGLARQAYEKLGRRLLNASTFSLLSEDILPRIDFNSIEF